MLGPFRKSLANVMLLAEGWVLRTVDSRVNWISNLPIGSSLVLMIMVAASHFRSSRTTTRVSRGILSLLVSALLGIGSITAGAAQKQKLDKTYKEWLERDAAYIITKEERDTFLRLATNDERDKFIERFWELRNPTPGAPENTYRDDIYKRIAFANATFGGEGWRTDRGRTYITLGPPQQKEVHYNAANLFPIEYLVLFVQSSRVASIFLRHVLSARRVR